MEAFPDPSTSPAHHVKNLCFTNQRNRVADTSRIRGFFNVVHFQWEGCWEFIFASQTGSLLPFHGFSPVIKSLCVHCITLPSSELFDLVLSFPLLEDLTTIDCYNWDVQTDKGNGSYGFLTVVQPSRGPLFVELGDV